MYENSFNSSIVDTSSFRAEDFAMFMDCIENIGGKIAASDKVKKTRKSRSRAHRAKDSDAAVALNKSTGCDLRGSEKRWAPSHFSSCYNLNDAHEPNALANITCSTINQTINDDIDASIVSEQFNLNEVFAYFNADFDKTRFEDSDSNDDDSGKKAYERDVDRENAVKNVAKEKPTRPMRPKRVPHETKSNKTTLAPIPSSSESERETATFKRPNAPPLGRKIIAAAKKPNGKLPTNDDFTGNRLNRTMNDAHVKQTQRYSSASTLSLHVSDSDSVGKKTSTADEESSYVAPNVRDKISFFNRTICEGTTPSPTPPRPVSTTASTPSASEDEDYQFQRQKSKRKFEQKREFFEKIFRDRFPVAEEGTSNGPSQNEHTSNEPKWQKLPKEKYVDKLEAVETYVQTKYLLERIQLLTKAISNMDEAQMEKMDLYKLKKFLLFIRDCSYSCQQVCFDISEKFLTDFEKNVMSAEELLFSALKAVHMQQVQSVTVRRSFSAPAECVQYFCHSIHFILIAFFDHPIDLN